MEEASVPHVTLPALSPLTRMREAASWSPPTGARAPSHLYDNDK